MSWQLGAFGLLALALAGGFAWYERVRPDARIVALVGTLAAFAALGRIAFAAVPNVKPTTDIVLISGYALGGGPGFAVGAIAGLASNFFFGQGPWTPWQMAAWGATGVVGAALAWVTSPRVRARLRWRRGSRREVAAGQPWIGRWPLAIVCFVAGFAFTVVQDVGDWVTYSDHSRQQLGIYVGKGLGFDAIHATGCLVFALAFGPALTRSVQRFARRLQVRWLPSSAVTRSTTIVSSIAVVAVVGLLAGLRTPGSASAASGLRGPVSYLLGAQNGDGGFGAAPGQSSNPLYSGWAALGLASAGYSPASLERGSRGLIEYIKASAGSARDVGSLERTILVIRSAGLPARSFGGHDLVAALERHVKPDGSVSDQVNLTSFAVLALRSAGIVPSRRTLAWLVRQQGHDGGFGFAGAGSESDVDDTGATLEALAGARVAGVWRLRARAVGYIRRYQDRDGGFPSQPGGGSNAQSTAWAIQGLDAAGVNPASLHLHGSASPLAYLRRLTAANGSVSYARGDKETPVWVTAEALMALEGKPLPLAAVGTSAATRAQVKTPAAAGTTHDAASSDAVPWLVAGLGIIAALLLAGMGLGRARRGRA
jgi:energy-coupling factor transport system substrate-specific component